MYVRNGTVRLAMLDYGAGNLHSLTKALERAGARVEVVQDAGALREADGMVLPGVGAFGAAAGRLSDERDRLLDAVASGYPAIGVCLGMQLLFDRSEEGPGEGLGVIPGEVRRLRARRVPHMGWNTVRARRSDPLVSAAGPLVAYFANSYAAEAEHEEDVVATTRYAGGEMPSVVRRGHAWGVQFHPEKSGAEGLALLEAFVGEVRAR